MVLRKICTPLEMELLAIKEALNWVFNTGYNKGVIQMDSKSVVNLINSKEIFKGNACFILEDVNSLLNSCSNLSYFFTDREANKATHVVAKHAAHSVISAC